MSLTFEEVEHIANLARLELSQAEKEHYRSQLSAILDYIRKLEELDTAGIPPTASVMGYNSGLRVDVSRPSLETRELLSNAPDHVQGQFRIPPVFE